MEFRAVYRYARIAPTKVHQVVNLIRGKTAQEGLNTLRYLPHRGARMVEKTLKSAIGNAEDRGARNAESLIIVEAKVDGGPMFKRIRPVSRGMAYGIQRKMSHIHVTLEDFSEL